MKIVSGSVRETKKLAKKLVFQLLFDKLRVAQSKHTIVLSLEGDLGSGKTTFTQGFAEGLGIRGKIQSPTFVILKIYNIPKSKKNLIHIDAYRLRAKDFKVLGWKEFINPPAGGPQNIILVEWGNRIRKILPKNTIRILFEHDTKTSRKITIK